jgi:hypothetical protein
VAWSVKCPEEYDTNNIEQELNCRRVVVKGIATNQASKISVTPIVNGKNKPVITYSIPASGDFKLMASFMFDGERFSAIISGNGQLELSRPTFHISSKPVGCAKVIA